MDPAGLGKGLMPGCCELVNEPLCRVRRGMDFSTDGETSGTLVRVVWNVGPQGSVTGFKHGKNTHASEAKTHATVCRFKGQLASSL